VTLASLGRDEAQIGRDDVLGQSTLNRRQYRFANAWDVLQSIMAPEVQYRIAFRLHECITPTVVFAFGVLAAIQSMISLALRQAKSAKYGPIGIWRTNL
jgi:hypothetical protein